MNRVKSLEIFGAQLRESLLATASLPIGGRSPMQGDEDISTVSAERMRDPERTAEDVSDPGFNQLALRLFSLQFEQNPAYRKFCLSRGLSPAGIQHWKEIPAVPACAFKELELSCIAQRQRTRVFFSSGTTQHRPSRHFHHATSLEIYQASLLAWFAVHLLDRIPLGASGSNSPVPQPEHPRPSFAGRVLALTPSALQAPHSSLVHMFETIRRCLGFRRFWFAGLTGKDGVWRLDCPRAIALLQEALDTKEPVMLLGTAFSYVHLLDHMVELGLRFQLPAGSRVLETGGYKGRSRAMPKSDLHMLVTRLLGIPPAGIVCEYGMSELSSQAYDQVAPRADAIGDSTPARSRPGSEHPGFHFPPWARVQIISPETACEVPEGGTGLIRVLDLANVYSVMAVQTEDLAVRRGHGFEFIGRAELAEVRGCSLMAV